MRVDWRVPLFVKVLCKVFFAPYTYIIPHFWLFVKYFDRALFAEKLVRNFLE